MCASSSTPASEPSGGDAGEHRADRAPASAPDGQFREFTATTLARYDGTDPHLAVLIAYRGRVYDVSGRFMWMNGRHFWLRAGRDLTGDLREAPHGEEMLEDVPCVGRLVEAGDDPAAEPRLARR
jgi:predicted heme/steroid binding protein